MTSRIVTSISLLVFIIIVCIIAYFVLAALGVIHPSRTKMLSSIGDIEQSNEIELGTEVDLADHNKLVLNQMDNYLQDQSKLNYTTDSISSGTLQFVDYAYKD